MIKSFADKRTAALFASDEVKGVDPRIGRRAISADTALRLARSFGTTAEFWVNLQSAYDLAAAKAALSDRVNAEVNPRAP